MSVTLPAAELESLSVDGLIDRLLAENKGPPCITCSFQAENMIVVDLLRKRRRKSHFAFSIGLPLLRNLRLSRPHDESLGI